MTFKTAHNELTFFTQQINAKSSTKIVSVLKNSSKLKQMIEQQTEMIVFIGSN